MIADPIDRAIVNALQADFPLCERPFAVAAERLGLSEDELIARIDRLLAEGTLTRFGPLFDAGRMGGGYALAAMAVTPQDVDRVAAIVNGFPEVAHHYLRDHRLSLWFVLATATPEAIDGAVARIEQATGVPVLAFPKEREYHVQMMLRA